MKQELIINYKPYFQNKRFLISIFFGIILLLISFVANFYAGTYATERASNYVNDIVLNAIPVYDVDYVFIYGPLYMWLIVGFLCLWKPQRIPFLLKSIALFIIIRSIFITLTHIGPFPDQALIDWSGRFISKFSFGGDLFFSAHTGLPFLMSFVFGERLLYRVMFICISIFFGIIVLMGHLHYSIDVLSAFFITYTIYHIARWLFKKDARVFTEGLKAE